MIKWAEPYAEAHGGFHVNSGVYRTAHDGHQERLEPQTAVRETGKTGNSQKGYFPFKCHRYNKIGHKWTDCRQQKYSQVNLCEIENQIHNTTTQQPGATLLCPDQNCTCSQVCAVTTRAGATKSPQSPVKPLRCLDLKKGLQLASAELRREQRSDPDHQKWREYALHGHPVGSKQNYRFQMKRGLLYRVVDDKGESSSQLVLPKSVRLAVMEVAHEGLLGGHFGINKTVSKIKGNFAWPGMFSEIRRFCQSCDRCQRVVSRDGHSRTYHANLLQLYRERKVTPEDEASVAVVEEEDHDDELPQVELPQLRQRCRNQPNSIY
ncbi:hypothetical protein Pmani_016513 [Petrolisthes manimaculis]|uniref:RNA-directed DNA polymerase n=1 Tax=Petrolisthes manimaculis TaxID=1843537 RepID=A0AAE1UAF5_9EUCA|nr:hypothetical protein Pmani_016513 [Petrolisthes manimaculis]